MQGAPTTTNKALRTLKGLAPRLPARSLFKPPIRLSYPVRGFYLGAAGPRAAVCCHLALPCRAAAVLTVWDRCPSPCLQYQHHPYQ
jgi:hypothetical protein